LISQRQVLHTVFYKVLLIKWLVSFKRGLA
jgi:hypothetical protein